MYKLSYDTNQGFWDLVLKLTPCISKDGEVTGNRISLDEFRILLWRYYGKVGFRGCIKLLDKKISFQRVQQKETRALKVVKQLFIDRYRNI